jgi:arylsulfatase A-like enzyme
VAQNGILFSNCYTPNAKSAPSRATILTGLYSWQAGEAGNHLTNFPTDLKVITDVLSENNYDIAYTGKGWAPGSSKNIDGSNRSLTGKAFHNKTLKNPTTGINANNYSANFSDFLDQNNGSKPWFFWFGSYEPHRPYEFESGGKLGLKIKNMINDFPSFLPDNDSVRNDLLDYAFEIEYFDKQIGFMLKELEKRSMLDNTIIIITSDNGMPFPRCKANSYDFSNHVPLAIMWKNGILFPDRKVSDYVNFVDFTPTFMDLSKVNFKKSGMEISSGKSLTGIFKSNKFGLVDSKRDYTILGRERDDYGRPRNQGYPIRGIIKDNLLYINNLKPELGPAGNKETGFLEVDGSPTKSVILNLARTGLDSIFWNLSFNKRDSDELYDISKDKFCINNLARNPEYKESIESLKKKLIQILIKQKDPRICGNGDVFDNYPYDIKEVDAWNFYENVVNKKLKTPWKITQWVNATDYENAEK